MEIKAKLSSNQKLSKDSLKNFKGFNDKNVYCEGKKIGKVIDYEIVDNEIIADIELTEEASY